MNRMEMIEQLNAILLSEMPQYSEQAVRFAQGETEQRRLLRSLMNVRPPMPLQPEYLALQDRLLSAERAQKGVVDGAALPPIPSDARIAIWQGDITRLKVDAIVDADNKALLGCFCPCHGCIDNAIHSAAGLQLRDECNAMMERQGHPEPNGLAKLTRGYNLPARHVLPTVGPIVGQQVTPQDQKDLASCYTSCLTLAAENGLQSIAFCCISTGEFHFPNREAAQIAVQTVKQFLGKGSSIRKVIFNVFKDTDAAIYRQLLCAD